MEILLRMALRADVVFLGEIDEDLACPASLQGFADSLGAKPSITGVHASSSIGASIT